jgi:addiction module HigA family antidote
MVPMGLTRYRLAKEIGVPAPRIGDIVSGKRAVTADTDLRLCRGSPGPSPASCSWQSMISTSAGQA